mgnify:CR=1 FL=1
MTDKASSPAAAKRFIPENSVGYQMRRIVNLIGTEVERRMEPLGLTDAQWKPLLRLSLEHGNTVAHLARNCHLDAGGMTRLLDRLETKGLCQRERSQEDRRVVQVERDKAILEALTAWIEASADWETQQFRQQRVDMYWGQGEWSWSEELALQRYELMYETGMLQESPEANPALLPYTGMAMQGDHRRIFATAISRLRAKIKYRPLIFDLMPAEFTLLQLQQSIETLAGLTLHKPNFRRLIQHQDLIEPTGDSVMQERGRPAQLYRFKPNVLKEQSLARGKMPLNK